MLTWHDCIEIIYIEKGKAEYFFNNEWTLLEEDTMLFIPPDKIHCLRTSDPMTEKYVFAFSTELISLFKHPLTFSGEYGTIYLEIFLNK